MFSLNMGRGKLDRKYMKRLSERQHFARDGMLKDKLFNTKAFLRLSDYQFFKASNKIQFKFK